MNTYYNRTYILTNKNNSYVLNISYYGKTNVSTISITNKIQTIKVSINGQCLDLNELNIKYKDNIFDISFNSKQQKPINRHFFLNNGRIKFNNYFKINQGHIKVNDLKIDLSNYKCLVYTYKGKYIGKYFSSYSYNFNNYGSFMLMFFNAINKIKLFYISKGNIKSIKLKCKIKSNSDIINLKANGIFAYIKYSLSLKDKAKVLTLSDMLSDNYLYINFSDKTLIQFENEDMKFNSEMLTSINIISYNL